MEGKPELQTREGDSSAPIQELDVVRLLAEVKMDEGHLPIGTIGTAVYRYRDGEAFEVEFSAPFHALLTLRANEIAAAHG
ncbi:hypothetical protein BH10PSE15_BH10PSE15_09930 [soil metagenome]